MVCDGTWLREHIPEGHMLNETRLHAQNTITILSTKLNGQHRRDVLYDHLMSMSIFPLIMNMLKI